MESTKLVKPSLLDRLRKKSTAPYTIPFPLTEFTASNTIRTAKYTLLTFLPKQFLFQFSKSYNLYFLVAALTVISKASALSPINQILPLCIVFFFSAGKEGIEDFARYKADKMANAVEYQVIRGGIVCKILSKDFTKGDIFYIEKGDKIPVDTLVLSSSFEDGTCFIETADLDGETNLKRRNAPTETSLFNTPSRISRLQGLVECEQPNVSLSTFTGRLTFKCSQELLHLKADQRNSIAYPDTPQQVSLNINHILLRGSVLQNTDYVYGLVLYTGLNTKIMMNLQPSKQKTSRLDSSLKRLTIAAFLYNAFLLISSVILENVSYVALFNQETQQMNALPQPVSPLDTSYYAQPYLGPQDLVPAKHTLTTFFSFFALYTYVIPISLFVTIEISRLVQGAFMMWDKQMRITRTHPDGRIQKMKMRANNTNLNEELGIVGWIFSDKTGTLTQNEMRVSGFYCGGRVLEEMQEQGSLFRYFQELNAEHREVREEVCHFVRCLTLCHSVIPALNEQTQALVYESQSPDETALLNAMSDTSSILTTRTKQFIQIETRFTSTFASKQERYTHLASLEFSSDRKRMSVVVRNELGEIFLYCKGADNVIIERLDSKLGYGVEGDGGFIDVVNGVLTDFSVKGLRTLCVAYRQVSEEEYAVFKRELDEAENALEEREEKVGVVADRFERSLVFAGCSAIEDRLQDEVPETISFLLQMGIKIWLLTGDKMETAINIGMSSKLIGTEMNLITLKSKTVDTCSADIDAALLSLEYVDKFQKNALVINGEALSFALDPINALELKFLALGVKCHSVICCRVTPLQKAMVVKLAKKNLKCVTLAIGDGANDVSMIQAADIGVGIQGREGAQAVRASDYSFAEFRFLRRLLSVHGRYSNHRLCQLIFISFYKNVTLITVQWYFGFLSGWSGQIAYEEIFLTAFNVIFTSLPPFILAIFDKDVSECMLDRYPQLYQEVQRGLYWNWKVITGWLLSMVWHSSVIFGTVYLMKSMGEESVAGRSVGYWIQCYLFGTPLLWSIMFKTALVTRHWTWFMAGSIGLSLLLYTILMFALPVFGYTPIGTAVDTHTVAGYYLLVLLNPVLTCLPDFVIMAYARLYWPTDTDIINEESLLLKKVGSSDVPMSELPNRDPL